MFALLQLLLPLLLLRLQQAFAYNYCQNATSYCEMANTVHFMCRLETELVSESLYCWGLNGFSIRLFVASIE